MSLRGTRHVKVEAPEAPAQAAVPTFQEVARRWLLRTQPALSNVKHRQQVEATLERFAYPVIGARSIDAITRAELVQAVESVGDRIETAHRVAGRITAVFDYAVDAGIIERHPASHLTRVLAPRRTQKHMASIPPGEAGQLMLAIRDYPETITRIGLQLAAHTFVRVGELLGMRWDEVLEVLRSCCAAGGGLGKAARFGRCCVDLPALAWHAAGVLLRLFEERRLRWVAQVAVLHAALGPVAACWELGHLAPAGRLERGASLAALDVGHALEVPERAGRPPQRPVQQAVGVARAIGARADDLEGQPVIERASNRPSGDADAYHSIVAIVGGHTEKPGMRRVVVPVVLEAVLLRLAQPDRANCEGHVHSFSGSGASSISRRRG